MAMRRRVEEHFDIRQVAEIYRKVYQYLVEGRPEEIWKLGHPVLSAVEGPR